MDSSLNTDIHARILIVDDDPMMRLLMSEALDNDCYDIAEFDNGFDAIEDIRNYPPDMVLLDVKMPGMSGFEVCTRIREKFDEYDIAVVMVTGLDDSESIEKAFELGATAFINKPINPITFPYRIQYQLSARHAFIELKQRETHLEYMDRISRILTHSNDLDLILKETLKEMRTIFAADRSVIIQSDTSHPYEMQLVCESISTQCQSLTGQIDQLIDEATHNSFYRARNSEYPISLVHTSGETDDPANPCANKQLLIKALKPLDDQAWYIILQRCRQDSWTAMQQETFYRITIRLGSVLAHHMLLQRLHENESLLRQAQYIGKLGNWSINIKTGELRWSDEIYRIYGYEPGVFLPSLNSLHHRVVKEDIERLGQFEQYAFYSGEKASIEYRIKLPDNQIRWIHKQGVGKFDENGNLIAINGTLQDITERVLKQEQELHDHKMDAVGQLTSGVAHDFGNLMTIAKGNLELIDGDFIERYRIDEEDQEIIEDARSAISDGVELTKQLLAFSRKKSISPEQLDIEQRISNFSHLFRKTLGDTIELSIRIQKDLPDIFVDSSQFESCLLNAVINARDAMPNGGTLKIHAKLHRKAPKPIQFNNDTVSARQFVCIAIADTGEGMSPSTLQKATEPFFTTKKHEGTGLGLSMIYGFMRQSNGVLDIRSKPGEGTCILMYFPVTEPANAPLTASSDKQVISTPASNAITVLVVEDREAVRRFAIRCLKTITTNILQAENADTAIDILNQHNNIQLLFSDILMPGSMNGRDLAEWVKENRPDIKILLTTASERETESNHASGKENFEMLPKPYSQQDLLNKIYEII